MAHRLLFFAFLTLWASLATASTADLVSSLNALNFTIVTPGDPNYPTASTAFNLRYTFEPAAVAYPTNAQQISALLKVSRQFNHQVVARSGGHSYIANGLGGKDGVVVVDMTNFMTVAVDSSTGTAIIGPGNRLGNVALALNDKGRALPHGTCPYVGVGGHSGFGGYGFTSRKWGLLLDTILSINVVLADGTIANVSQTTHPDLFWALRGSSASFGIVTAIQVMTFPTPSSATVFEYNWNLNAADAAKAVGAFQHFVQTNIPQEFAAEIVIGKGSVQGNLSWGLTGGWYGPADQFQSVIAPFLAKVPKPASTSLTPGTYINSVQFLGGLGRLNTSSSPDGHDTFYAKSLMTPEASPMSNAARTAFMSYLANDGFNATTDWFVEIELYGGTNSAINNVPIDATAFAHRSSMFTIQFYTSAPGNVPPFPPAGFSFLDEMVNSIVNNSPKGWDYGAYANYIDDRLQNWQQLYYGPHYPRLKALKDQYDPMNTFSFPTSIEE